MCVCCCALLHSTVLFTWIWGKKKCFAEQDKEPPSEFSQRFLSWRKCGFLSSFFQSGVLMNKGSAKLWKIITLEWLLNWLANYSVESTNQTSPKFKKRQKNVILTSFLKIFWPMYIVVVFLVVLKGNLVRFLFLWPGAVPCKIVVRLICSILLIHYVFISILIHKYSSNAEWFFMINIYYMYT